MRRLAHVLVVTVAVAGGATGAAAAETPTFSVGYRSQVFIAKRDGGVRRLTGGTTYHASPVWSHRGRRIATLTGDGIAILSLDGRVRHAIDRGGNRLGPPAWAPGDRRVAFVRYRCAAACHSRGDVVVSGLDGRHEHVVAHRAVGQVEWAADGSALYFTRQEGDYYEPKTVYAVGARGGAPRRLATDMTSESRLVPSPDGRSILFRRESLDKALWIAATDGSGARRVVGNSGYYGWYGWLQGGRAVFGGKRETVHPVVTTLDGEHRALRVAFRSPQYSLPDDGGRVAWVGGVGLTKIRSARPDGSGFRELVRFGANNNSVDVDRLEWSPDGRLLAIEPYKHSGD